MTTGNSAAVGSAATSAWAWPLDVNRFRRRGQLSEDESDALHGLGFDLLRSDRDRDHPGWKAIARLTAPLDETLAVVHWHPDTAGQQRFARYGAAIVLQHCAKLGSDFWSWSTHQWTDLRRPQQLRQRFAGQLGMQARPYLLAYAYLLAGFTAFDQVGPFSRHALAQRVFGVDLVEEAIQPVRAVLAGWGYRAANLESMIATLLLLNRSPMLADLSSPVLARLRSDDAIQRHFHGRHLHGVHRALAALGHAGPPPAPRYGDGPVPITGTAPGWAHTVERWHATATIQSGTRDTGRVVLAKIGRAGRRTPRHHQSGRLDRPDLRVLDRHRRPDAGRRPYPIAELARQPPRTTRKTVVTQDETHLHSDRPHLLSRPAGLGLDPAPVRPRTGTGHPAQHPGPART